MPSASAHRSGTAGDRRPLPDPLLFREGLARSLDEASDVVVQKLVDACRDDLRIVAGGTPDADDALDLLRRPLPGAAIERRLALGVFDRAGDLVAAVDVYRDLPQAGSWLLGYLIVRPDLRNRGLATGLLARVERLAARAGCARLEAVAPARSPATLQCLRRAGFTPQREVELSSSGRPIRGVHLTRDLIVSDAAADGAPQY